MRKFRIDEISFVDRPAQEGAVAVFMKRAITPEDGESIEAFVKRYPVSNQSKGARVVEAALVHEGFAAAETFAKYHDSVPVMTEEADGHAHLIWLHGSRGGETTMQISAGDEHHHDHPWVIKSDGVLVIAQNSGHTHGVSQESVFAAMQEMLLDELDAPDAVVDVVFARAPDGDGVDVSKMSSEDLLGELQAGTLVAKFTDGQPVPFAASMSDGSFPIRCSADLATAISLVGSDGDKPQVARHIVKRARVLGLVDQLPEEGPLAIVEAGPAGDAINKNRPGGHPVSDKKTAAGGGEDLQKRVDELTAQNAELTKSLETAGKVAKLSEPHRTFYEGLGGGDEKAAFLSKSESDRQAQVDEITKGDPIEYTALDGTEYRKSAGAGTIRLAKQVDEQAKRLAKAESEKATAEFQKRANGELSHLAGSVEVRAEVLKAVEAIEDDGLRKGALETLKAANTMLGKGLERRGTSQVPSPDADTAEAQLNALAKSYAEEHDVDFYTAYDKVANQRPELAKAAIDGQ
jgi:hypothetical protein